MNGLLCLFPHALKRPIPGLRSNAREAMLQIRHISFTDLPTVTKPDELGFPEVQPEAVGGHQAHSTSRYLKLFFVKEKASTTGRVPEC